MNALHRTIRCSALHRLGSPQLVASRDLSWSRNPFFTSASPPRPRSSAKLWRPSVWLVPVAGGIAFCLYPKQDNFLPNFLSSSAVIPPSVRPLPYNATILSPSEADLTVPARIASLFYDHIWEPIRTAARFFRLFVLLMPVIVTSPMVLVGIPDKRLGGDRWGAVWWYGLLVNRMEAAGPTFIKLAQWAGSRTDLFPAILCEKLGSLHSHVKPHPFRHTKHVIESVFRMPFEDIFEEFKEEPIGTGAIAQVYRATIKKDHIPPSYLDPRRVTGPRTATLTKPHPPPSVPSTTVAIKVVHPLAAKTIERDLSIMSAFARVLTYLPGMEWLSIPEEVEVFGSMMRQQLDLRHEAQNLLVFEENFERRRVPVTFPRPLGVFSNQNILIEEYQNAVPLENFLKNGGGPFDDQVATIGLDAFLNMLLLDNFVHSDLHPGNIMVKFTKPPSTSMLLSHLFATIRHGIFPSSDMPPVPPHIVNSADSDAIATRLRSLSREPKSWKEELSNLHSAGYCPEIVFIDAGLVTSLDNTNRRNFLDLFRAVAQFDGYRVGQLMVERCRTPQLAIDPETFSLKLQHVVLAIKRKTFSLGQIRLGDCLTQVLNAARTHHVKMESDFTNTVISILLLEGIGRQLDPGLDLFKSALPILRQLGRQMANQDTARDMHAVGNLAPLLKVWAWAEARELASTAFSNVDDLLRYDWLTPNV